MKIIGGVLTIVLGAAPATYLSLVAGLGVLLGIGALVTGELAGLVFVVWGLAGIYGTTSLWAIGFGYSRPWVVFGLVTGTAALAPLTGDAAHQLTTINPVSDPEGYLLALALTGPIIVAVARLGVLTVRAFRLPRAPSTTKAARA